MSMNLLSAVCRATGHKLLNITSPRVQRLYSKKKRLMGPYAGVDSNSPYLIFRGEDLSVSYWLNRFVLVCLYPKPVFFLCKNKYREGVRADLMFLIRHSMEHGHLLAIPCRSSHKRTSSMANTTVQPMCPNWFCSWDPAATELLSEYKDPVRVHYFFYVPLPYILHLTDSCPFSK